ncbi:RNA-directed DNA polymerase like [Apostasia shenzhenica]|uniref:RNA-directed DNA polymerase like n=1 Tax=Apostasia shenzhenica TaxID=1088818 RepID=A0A2I0B9F1_9ASPA|nr:RNA-directed DNA polymerase like [Apostasia shenzhenica]
MCVDFTDLNKACPKDFYPLPKIDRLIDSSAGYSMMSFIDAFSGYHQIRMTKDDEKHTSFITDQGTFCYKVMPFSLKNAGATYQRMIDTVFKKQRGRNIEAYVDDVLIKSKCVKQHIEDLRETLDTC